MNYKIEKIKSTSKEFGELAGMEVLTYISPITGKKYIDGPTDLQNYDKYYEWLRKETNKWNMSVSDSLEGFKKEFIIAEGELIPIISEEADITELNIPNLEYILAYNEKFNEYFKEAKAEIDVLVDIL